MLTRRTLPTFMWHLKFGDHIVVCHSPAQNQLADADRPSHALIMFVVTEADAAAIRAAFDQGGEFPAAVELRRRFPGITDNDQARECARTIAAWKPLPLRKVRRPPRTASIFGPATHHSR